MTDNNAFKQSQDHPMHRKAKLQKLKGRKFTILPDPHQEPRIVTCPECGVTFDSNISTKSGFDFNPNFRNFREMLAKVKELQDRAGENYDDLPPGDNRERALMSNTMTIYGRVISMMEGDPNY